MKASGKTPLFVGEDQIVNYVRTVMDKQLLDLLHIVLEEVEERWFLIPKAGSP